jgi:predicted DNA-binding transcriptional regulator YafY
MASWDGESATAAWRKVERWRVLANILHSGRFTLTELEEKLGALGYEVGIRTIQRDLEALTLLLQENATDSSTDPSSYGVRHTAGSKRDRRFFLDVDQHPLPSLHLTPGEARALLFAVRLLVHSSREQEQDTRSLLTKLSAAFPGIIGTVANETISQIDSLPRLKSSQRDSRDLTLLELTNAWTRGGLVMLSYRGVGSERVDHGWCFQPLLLEPSKSNGGAYVIGFRFDDEEPVLRSLRLDRISRVQRHPDVCPKTHLQHKHDALSEVQHELPKLLEVIGRSWSGIVVSDEWFPVEFRFRGDAVTRAQEARWRSETKVRQNEDGTLTVTGRYSQWWDLRPWILSWGSDAEVISPPELRAEVISHLQRATEMYSQQSSRAGEV